MFDRHAICKNAKVFIIQWYLRDVNYHNAMVDGTLHISNSSRVVIFDRTIVVKLNQALPLQHNSQFMKRYGRLVSFWQHLETNMGRIVLFLLKDTEWGLSQCITLMSCTVVEMRRVQLYWFHFLHKPAKLHYQCRDWMRIDYRQRSDAL